MKRMEILGKIFSYPGRVRVMRLFILNKNTAFTRRDVVKRCRVNSDDASYEIKMLHSVGYIKKKGKSWIFNSGFKYKDEFENVLAGNNIFDEKFIVSCLRGAGRLKLLVAAGFFLEKKEGQIDLLIVGERLNKRKLDQGIKKIEAETGKELIYAVFNTKEFKYRLGMYDKLVRDVLDFPHKVILESKELSTQVLKKP